MNVSDLAALLDAEVMGDGTLTVGRPCHPDDAAGPEDIAVALDKALVGALADSRARIGVITGESREVLPDGALDTAVIVGRPQVAMAALTTAFARPAPVPPGIHPSAVIDESATLGADVSVGPFTVIGPGARIGDGTVIASHVTVGAGVTIGAGGLLHAGVRIGDGCTIGASVIVHHNASIGADGFSFVTPEKGSVESAKDSGRVEATNTGILRVHSLAAVTLGDHVEIGANACIDRGTLRDTRIGNHTKIDDLVLIGHNVSVGDHCMLCGRVGVAGSVKIGNRVVLAGGVGVADHVSIGDDAVVGAGSGVASSLKGRQVYIGYPAIERDRALEGYLHLQRLGGLINDVKSMKAALKASGIGLKAQDQAPKASDQS
jgi:UDP-3-O-[3-hydroxymyristoyl] glucosamine N-acyltransferase